MASEPSLAYGWLFIGLILVFGVGLLIFRPYWAFLFAVFVSVATSINMGLTRTEELGAYFQLADACMLVMMMAFLWEKKQALLIPAPFVVLLAVLTMGFVNSFLHMGLTYDVLRAWRWGITFPLMIFLAANFIQDERRVRSLLLILILAAIAAEAQHFLWILQGRQLVGEDISGLRSIQFSRCGADVWLLAGFYTVAGAIPHPWVQIAIGALFLIGIVANQTRSVALGFMGALLVFYFWFLKGPNAFRWERFKGLLPIFAAGIFITAAIGLTALFSGYGERLTRTYETGSGTQSRWNALDVELHDWLDGNPLIGRGLSYYATRKFRRGLISKTGIAYGHLGYISYLSQLGLIGFAAYGFWLPLVVLWRARRLLQQPNAPPAVVHLAALTGASFIYYPLMFLFSSSFLGVMYLPGILAGGVWGMTAFKLVPSEVLAPEPPSPPKELPRSIIAEPFQGMDRGRPSL